MTYIKAMQYLINKNKRLNLLMNIKTVVVFRLIQFQLLISIILDVLARKSLLT